MSQPSALRKRVEKVCMHCRGSYLGRADHQTQQFCSKRCGYDWKKAQPRRHTRQTIRRLRDDEPVPPGKPARYIAGTGYVVLRWKVGVRQYVEAFEHRIVTGRVSPEVHHINGVKTDNRPENLMPVTTLEHGAEHAKWNIEEACERYRAGWSLCALSRDYGVNTTQVLRSLRKRGVRMRTMKEASALRYSRVA